MTSIYIIPGYGIPPDIRTDKSYLYYKDEVLKHLTQKTQKEQLVIFSGGNTDTTPPYNRFEAKEIESLFKSDLEKLNIKYLLETQSISSLENLVNCNQLIQTKKITPNQVTIFCESKRLKRVTTLAQKIFSSPTIIAVNLDFNPYDDKQLNLFFQKEMLATELSLEALDNPTLYKELHNLYEEKFTKLRSNK